MKGFITDTEVAH